MFGPDSSASDGRPPVPQLAGQGLEPREHDFGIVVPGSTLSADFEVPGGVDGLPIGAVRVSCGACTTARMSAMSVEPGEAEILSVDFKAPLTLGERIATVSLIPKGPGASVRIYRLRATVEPLYHVVPEAARFGDVALGEARAIRVGIRVNRPASTDRPVAAEFASTAEPCPGELRWLPIVDGLDARWIVSEGQAADASSTVEVTLADDVGAGPVRSTLRVALLQRGATGAEPARSATVQFAVTATVLPPLVAEPAILGLGVVRADQTREGEFTLRWRESVVLGPLEVSCSSDRLQVQLVEDRVLVSVSHAGLPGTLRETVDVHLVGEDSPILSVPVVAVLK